MGFWRDDPAAVPRTEAPIDFRPALIDPRLFPFDIYVGSAPSSCAVSKKNLLLTRVRKAIRAIFICARPSPTTSHSRAPWCVVSDDVVVTSGAQQAFDLLARILVTPGETAVAVEDPGYPPMRVAFAAAGARIVAVPVDEEGLIVDRLPPRVGVICVCPSHQFPLGVTMSKRRRAALVDFARRHGAVIVEDDYDGEFRYGGNPLQSLRAADAADVVFYVGTFSKCMLPSLRLGFVVVPDWARANAGRGEELSGLALLDATQTGVSAFITEGHLARHVRKMRQIYRARRQLLNDCWTAISRIGWSRSPHLYGMHVAAWAGTVLIWKRMVRACPMRR